MQLDPITEHPVIDQVFPGRVCRYSESPVCTRRDMRPKWLLSTVGLHAHMDLEWRYPMAGVNGSAALAAKVPVAVCKEILSC